MHKLCVPIVSVALLAGSVGGCTSETVNDEEAYRPAVFVTGEVVGGSDWGPFGEGTKAATGDHLSYPGVVGRFTWESSDPLMSGDVTVVNLEANAKEYGGSRLSADQRQAFVAVWPWEVVNADGRRWLGHATAIGVQQPPFSAATIVLSSGGHTAYLVTDGDFDEPSFRGLIFPGPMPPLPELPAEPPAE